MPTLSEQLAENILRELCPELARDPTYAFAPEMKFAAGVAAKKLAALVEGGWLRHGADKGARSYCGAVWCRYTIRLGYDTHWHDGDESSCTCGLARALGMEEK